MSALLKRTAIAATSVLAAATLLAGCQASNSTDGDSAGQSDSLQVYATTGYLADAVKNIAPDAEITTMVGPGGDPHTYQPTTKDIEKMRDSDAVVWNGLHLEAQMIDELQSLGDKQLAVGEGIDEAELIDWPETDDEGNPLHDPHIWNSPEIWQQVVTAVADHLAKLDKDNAETYKDNAVAYNKQITETSAEVEELLSTVGEPRVLISGHDAFNYFGKVYNLEVHATDFVSTEAQLSASQISELADLIAEKQVPAIFLDNQASPQAITSLQEAVKSRGWDVKIANEELFADSLGAEAPVDTYLGVLKHNAEAVSQALSK